MSHPKSQSRWKAAGRGFKQGFTLIELLVVIAIIALLAAILFPVFGRARENARKSACLNNIKQLGLGMLQYTQDYDETFPWGLPISGQTWPGIGWAGMTNPYIKSAQVYRCPNDTGGGSSAAFGSTQISYAFSTTVAQKNHADITQPTKMVMLSEVSVGFNVVYSNTQENGDYRSPADYGDNLVWGQNQAVGSIVGQCCGTILNNVYGANRTGRYRDGTASNADARNVARHLNGANFLMVDGHAKWYTGSNVSYQAANAGSTQISYFR